MLRGPQTPGELRSRSERLFAFDDLTAVQATLDRLAAREPASELAPASTGPLTTILPRQPGSREARYAHLLSGEPVQGETSLPAPSEDGSAAAQRLATLEAEVAALTSTLRNLQARVERLEEEAPVTFRSPTA
jgi:uncharacterized protein YceH (UPF0502 family)